MDPHATDDQAADDTAPDQQSSKRRITINAHGGKVVNIISADGGPIRFDGTTATNAIAVEQTSDDTAGQGGDTTDSGTTYSTPDGFVSNVNYAAPGATVGFQGDVVIGATVVMNGRTVSTSSADFDDDMRHTVAQAKVAAAQAKVAAAQVRAAAARARAAGEGTTHHSADGSTTTVDEFGNVAITNVASGGDHVAFQIGVQNNFRPRRR
jgi:hypothetical protein